MRRRLTLTLAWTLACAPKDAGDPSAASTTATTGTTDLALSSSDPAPTTGDASTGDASTGAADDGPRIHQLQALGTHNSYHVSPGPTVKSLDYTHRPLPQQLDAGVRQFELDINFKEPGAPIEVYHLQQIDQMSTCATLADCLTVMRGWSGDHPGHQILYVMLELKTPFNAILFEDLFATLEAQILDVWPREAILAPADVQGDAPDLRSGLAAGGWPTIAASRDKIMLVLHDGGPWRDRYVEPGLADRLLFPDAFGDLALPFAAVHTLNDPVGDLAAISAALDAGHLVRTRADADNVEPFAGDTTRAAAALASAATFISTDYPPPMGELDYVFAIPDGTPSRCNPRTAPPGCTPAQIEDL